LSDSTSLLIKQYWHHIIVGVANGMVTGRHRVDLMADIDTGVVIEVPTHQTGDMPRLPVSLILGPASGNGWAGFFNQTQGELTHTE